MSTDAAAMLRSALHEVTRNLVERETLVELIALAAVAGEHVLIVGPPGTAKSVAVRRMASAIGGRYFEYLLGRFTEPSEIFGPVDLRELREGVIKTDTSGMLPEAEIAFLDEVFLGSTAILNTLLGLLNERIFRRGHTEMRCPLRVCVGASNRLPDDPALDAFADRFLVHAFVEPVVDPMLELLLESGDALSRETFSHRTDVETLDALVGIARQIDIGPIRGALADALRELRHAGIGISDRRAVKSQRLIAAATAIAGRTMPSAADLWPLVFAIPTAEGQSIARDVLHDRLAPSENAALPAAAVAASSGPQARAGRLLAEAQARLAEAPDATDRAARRRWALRLEGILREIDAGLEPASLDATLTAVRTQVVAIVAGELDRQELQRDVEGDPQAAAAASSRDHDR